MNAPAAETKTLTLQPSLFRAWCGIWLLTWKSQFTWQKLPKQILGLLLLPVLVYLTPMNPSQNSTLLGDPGMQLNNFASRLLRAKTPLQPDQRTQLRQIFQDEFARTETAWLALEAGNSARRNEQIEAGYEKLQIRAKAILDERQFAALQTFCERNIRAAESSSPAQLWTRTSPFYHWLIDFYFFIVLPLNCVRLCGGLIRDELQTNTLSFLTTRPLGRARLLVLKYFSQTAWLQILLLLETLLIFTAGRLHGIPSLGALLPLFLAAQFLAVFAWSALGIFLGQITQRYVAAAIVYGAVVEMGIGRIPTNINTLSLTKHLKTLLAHHPALQSTYEWTSTGVPLSVSALILAPIIFVSLGALLFTYLEYHHTTEMQK
jgi:ABC-type transport system involved in multi-copper enzyme maturation permease subunit